MHSASDHGQQRSLVCAPSLVDFALMAESLPSIAQAVQVAEVCRRALLALHRVPSQTLAGKDALGTPLTQQHRHAHYIPDCRGFDPLRMTHLVVYAPGGFSSSELQTLMSLSQLSRTAGPLAVVPQAVGRPDILASSSRLFGSYRRFASRTPFLCCRDIASAGMSPRINWFASCGCADSRPRFTLRARRDFSHPHNRCFRGRSL